MPKQSKYVTQKEVGLALNNCVASQYGSEGLKALTGIRKSKLMNYTAAVVQPLVQHIKEGYITPEELSLVLSAGSLFVFGLFISKRHANIKLPLYEDTAVTISEGLEAE